MMEVLFVSHKYPPSTGGMQKQSFELIKGMAGYTRVHTILYDGSSSKALFLLTLRYRIKQICNRNPDIGIVHFNDAAMATLCSGIVLSATIKKVVTVHGLDVVFPLKIYQRKMLAALQRCQLIIAVSEATRMVCIRQGINEDKCVVVANGVDASLSEMKSDKSAIKKIEQGHRFKFSDKPYLVMMGRAVRRKGFSWFAANILPLLNEECRLVIVGPFSARKTALERVLDCLPGAWSNQIELMLGYPSDERALRPLLKHPNKRLIHLGKLPFKDLVQVLKHSCGFVMPNIQVEGDMEGFGLVCLEASLCGAMVFAADIDGIPQAIQHQQNGILLPSGNAAVWVEQLNYFLDNSNNTALKETALQYSIQHFSWSKMVAAYWQQFQLLCSA